MIVDLCVSLEFHEMMIVMLQFLKRDYEKYAKVQKPVQKMLSVPMLSVVPTNTMTTNNSCVANVVY
jgi:hypothetical protein